MRMLYTSCRMLGALRPDETTDPEAALPETLFDGLGRAVHTQDRRTRTAQHTFYDDKGRVSDRTVSGVALDFTNMALTTTSLSHTNYAYDAADRVVQTNRRVFVPTGVLALLARLVAVPVGDTGPLDGNGSNYKPLTATGTAATDWIADRQIYDRLGRVVKRLGNPSPAAPSATGDNQGVTLSQTKYDGLGRAIWTQDYLGNTSENWYDANGNVTETRRTDVATVSGTNSAAFLNTRFYDALDRLVLEVDNAGHATDLRYDGLGRLALRADARGRNVAGRTILRRGASNASVPCNDYGNVTLTNYDSHGRRVREDKVLTVSGTGDGVHLGLCAGAPATPLAWRAFPTTSTHPVAASRLAAESVPLLPDAKTGADHPGQGGGDGLITVRYQYDLAGRLVALIDDNGNETDWSYDCLGRKIAETKGVPGWPASGHSNLADVHPAPTTIQWTYNATTGYLDTMTRERGGPNSVATIEQGRSIGCKGGAL